MCEGEIRKLHIPASMAYGTSGSPSGKVGPNEDLVFEVELLKIIRHTELWIHKGRKFMTHFVLCVGVPIILPLLFGASHAPSFCCLRSQCISDIRITVAKDLIMTFGLLPRFKGIKKCQKWALSIAIRTTTNGWRIAKRPLIPPLPLRWIWVSKKVKPSKLTFRWVIIFDFEQTTELFLPGKDGRKTRETQSRCHRRSRAPPTSAFKIKFSFK